MYFENLQKKDPFLAMPEDFVMCGTFTREEGREQGGGWARVFRLTYVTSRETPLPITQLLSHELNTHFSSPFHSSSSHPHSPCRRLYARPGYLLGLPYLHCESLEASRGGGLEGEGRGRSACVDNEEDEGRGEGGTHVLYIKQCVTVILCEVLVE